MKARYLLVDDEPMARVRLERLIMEIEPDAEVLQAGDGDRALTALTKEGPFEACFLDVEMPGLGGFEIARRWPSEARETALIFCTAYPKYAVQAFQVAAVDYLVKPVSAERLRQALARTARMRATGPTLLLKVGDKAMAVPWQDIICFKASQKLTAVLTHDHEYLTDKSLDQLESELPPAEFCRCHRSALVNVRHVLSVSGGGGDAKAELKRGQEVPVSRRKKTELMELLQTATPKT